MAISWRFCYLRRRKICYITTIFVITFMGYNFHNRYHPNYPAHEVFDLTSNELKMLNALDLQLIAKEIPQLPVEQLIKGFSQSPIKSNKCSIIPPSLWQIEFNNDYWQIFKTQDGIIVYMFGAYYDDRFVPNKTSFVRLSVILDRIKPPAAYCQMWFNNTKNPIVSSALFRLLWHEKWGNYKDGELLPYLITCAIPPVMESRVPISVSLIENKCQNATNNLNVFNERKRSEKPSFAVCVKGLAFRHNDLSHRLIEWIELLKILGVRKIYFYELVIHPNMKKVLSYYEKIGFVQVTKLSLPGSQPNFPQLIESYLAHMLVRKRQNEVIPYNDCFYRNIHSYDFIALLDLDEIILPTSQDLFTWKDMILSLKNLPSKDAICARNVYFFDDWENKNSAIPRHLHMMRHVVRSVNYSEPTYYVKCLHNTSRVVGVHNHFPNGCLHSDGKKDSLWCEFHTLSTRIAHLQHYRKDCTYPLQNKCKDLQKLKLVDTTIHRYLKDLIRNTEIVHKNIDL